LEKDAKVKSEKRPRTGKKKLEILALLQQWLPEMAAGCLSVFFLDECHLLWGDACGYVWGQTNIRIEVPIVNEREKQTYFGALDYFNQEFLLQAYDRANSEHTISFLDYLQQQRPGQRLVVIWDGASYHRSFEVKEYLHSLNPGADESSWQLTCIRFAPNAPEQNPVEDIWLMAKRFVREFYHLCNSFSVVKLLFELVTHRQTFDFPKLSEYAVSP
jgi:transposase